MAFAQEAQFFTMRNNAEFLNRLSSNAYEFDKTEYVFIKGKVLLPV